MPTRRTFLKSRGGLDPKKRRVPDAPWPKTKHASRSYKHELLAFFDKPNSDIETEWQRLVQQGDKSADKKEREEIQWRLTALEYLKNARAGKEPTSNIAKVLTILTQHEIMNYDLIDRYLGVPHYVTEKIVSNLRKNPQTPKHILQKLDAITKKSDEISRAEQTSRRKMNILKFIIEKNPRNLEAVHKFSKVNHQTLKGWFKEWTTGKTALSNSELREKVKNLIPTTTTKKIGSPPTPGRKKTGTRERGKSIGWAMRSSDAKKRTLQYIMENAPQTQREIVKGAKVDANSLRRCLREWRYGPYPIKNPEKGPGRNIEELLRRLESQPKSPKYHAIREKIKWKFVDKSSEEIEEEIRALQDRLKRVKFKERENILYEKIIALNDMKNAKERKKYASHTSKIMIYLFNNLEAKGFKVHKMCKGLGITVSSAEKILARFRKEKTTPGDIRQQLLNALPEKHPRPFTNILTNPQKWKLINHPVLQAEIDRKIEKHIYARRRIEAKRYLEKFLFDQLDRLPALEDVGWFLGIRINYGIWGYFRTLQRNPKHVSEVSKEYQEQMKQDMKAVLEAKVESPVLPWDLVKNITKVRARPQLRKKTNLLSAREKNAIIYHQSTGEVITKAANRILREYSKNVRGHIEDARIYIEKRLFDQLDYLPSRIDIDWFVSTRAHYATREFMRDHAWLWRYTEEKRKELEQQLVMDIKQSPVEREALRLIEEEEEKKKKG